MDDEQLFLIGLANPDLLTEDDFEELIEDEDHDDR